MCASEVNIIKTVTVLLTKYDDWASVLISFISGAGYTHASLALDDASGVYYSFNYRGFCTETLEKHRRHGAIKSAALQISVSDAAYERLAQLLVRFRSGRSRLRYTRFGAFCCALGIPFRWKRHYFCSQFVAELLENSGAVPLKRPPELFLPNHFCKDLAESGQLVGSKIGFTQ